MNDKDKEAFEKWEESHIISVVGLTEEEARKKLQIEMTPEKEWQAACEYKQKEIDELEKEKDYLCKKMENMREIYKNSEKLQDENAKLIEQDQIISQEIKTYIHIADRLKAENVKLRLVVDHYAQADDVGAYARIILKELGEK